MFLLDLLDNLPRLRVSSSLMRVVLWMLHEAGARDVPSLDRLRSTQKEIRKDSGIPSVPCVSPLGNVFFMNDPRAIVKQVFLVPRQAAVTERDTQDWANPAIRKFIQIYPEEPADGVVREIWHADKWCKDMDGDALTPMYDGGGAGHFYVNEVARLRDEQLVVPVRWVIRKQALHADCHTVTIDAVSASGAIPILPLTRCRAGEQLSTTPQSSLCPQAISETTI
jgi:hypothetical protein